MRAPDDVLDVQMLPVILQVAIYYHLGNEQKRESAILATRVRIQELLW